MRMERYRMAASYNMSALLLFMNVKNNFIL